MNLSYSYVIQQRDVRVDILKGVCIILVVWGHLPVFGDVGKGIVKWIYTFHMPVFMFITGYLWKDRCYSKASVLKVLNRLFKPFLVFGILSAVLYVIASKIGLATSNQFDTRIGKIPMQIITGNSGGELWYLYTCGVFEIITLFGFWLTRRLFDKDRGILLSLSIAAIFCYILSKLGLNIRYEMTQYFIVGYLLGISKIGLPDSLMWTLPAMLILASFDFSSYSFISLLWSLSLVGILVRIFSMPWLNKSCVGRALSFVGKHTLEIYLFHPMISVVLRPFSGLILDVEPSGIGLNVVFCFVIVMISLLIGILIRRTPLKFLVW